MSGVLALLRFGARRGPRIAVRMAKSPSRWLSPGLLFAVFILVFVVRQAASKADRLGADPADLSRAAPLAMLALALLAALGGQSVTLPGAAWERWAAGPATRASLRWLSLPTLIFQAGLLALVLSLTVFRPTFPVVPLSFLVVFVALVAGHFAAGVVRAALGWTPASAAGVTGAAGLGLAPLVGLYFAGMLASVRAPEGWLASALDEATRWGAHPAVAWLGAPARAAIDLAFGTTSAADGAPALVLGAWTVAALALALGGMPVPPGEELARTAERARRGERFARGRGGLAPTLRLSERARGSSGLAALGGGPVRTLLWARVRSALRSARNPALWMGVGAVTVCMGAVAVADGLDAEDLTQLALVVGVVGAVCFNFRDQRVQLEQYRVAPIGSRVAATVELALPVALAVAFVAGLALAFWLAGVPAMKEAALSGLALAGVFSVISTVLWACGEVPQGVRTLITVFTTLVLLMPTVALLFSTGDHAIVGPLIVLTIGVAFALALSWSIVEATIRARP